MTRCEVCGLRIRRANERDRPWLHDDPAYDPFKPPIHAPRPADAEGRADCGHDCCDERSDQHHDHFLRPADCSSCANADR